MKRLITIINILTIAICMSAQTAEPNDSLRAEGDSFEAANALYAEGNYAEAAEIYEMLIVQNPQAELYYNLGNARFKQGELAQSILAYERALRIKPYHKDAKYNLRFAQSQIIDNIDTKDGFFIGQWLIAIRQLLSEQWWCIISICLFILMLAGLFAFAFGNSTALRRAGFHSAWVALLLSVSAACFAWGIHSRDKERAEAIVMQGIVNVKASPDKSGTDLFTLHEGTKVHVRSTLTDWVEITVGDNRGWLKASAIERI